MNVIDIDNSPEDGNWFFRIVDVRYSDGVSLYNYSFRVVRKTPKGCFIAMGVPNFDGSYNKKNLKFIRDKGKKKWAYPTKDEALKGFIHRKRSQVQILREQLQKAEMAYKIAGGDWPIRNRYLIYDDLY